jgi:hypothetical protein
MKTTKALDPRSQDAKEGSSTSILKDKKRQKEGTN